MNQLAIIGARMPRRAGCVAIISGALLGAVPGAGPAQSGDLYYPYGYSAYRYNGCYRNCYPCGHYRCGCYRCDDCCSVARPIAPVAVAERHWVERDYWERRFPVSYGPCGYGSCGNAGYPNYYGGYPAYYGGYPNYYSGYPNYYGPRYSGPPRPHLGFGGVQYPPAAISYEHEAPPGPPAGTPYYTAGFLEEPAPRPPAGIPYYNAGYFDGASPAPPVGMPYYNAGYVE